MTKVTRAPGRLMEAIGGSPLTLFGVGVGIVLAVVVWFAIAHVNGRVDRITERVTIIERKTTTQATAAEKAKATTCDPAKPNTKACQDLKTALGKLTPAEKRTLRDKGTVQTKPTTTHTTAPTQIVTSVPQTSTTPSTTTTRTTAQAPASAPSASTVATPAPSSTSTTPKPSTRSVHVGVTAPALVQASPDTGISASTPEVTVQTPIATTTVPTQTIQVDPSDPVGSVVDSAPQDVQSTTDSLQDTLNQVLNP